MKFEIDLGSSSLPEAKDGEELTTYTRTTIKTLLASSAKRTLTFPFSIENQQKIAEEIGYRRALLDLLFYFGSQGNT